MCSQDLWGTIDLMYPEDRVLVAYMSNPADFAIARSEHWYRIPQATAPKGLYAEVFAFYFGRRFGEEKWAIHYYARRMGHELATRRMLFPDQPDHPRAGDLYYVVQLGPLQKRETPIISLRWRRITFIHTTWDRFQDAHEINDLFVEGGDYVDRLYATLKENGLHPERNYLVREPHQRYVVPLAIPCRRGAVTVTEDELPRSDAELANVAAAITREVLERGGAR